MATAVVAVVAAVSAGAAGAAVGAGAAAAIGGIAGAIAGVAAGAIVGAVVGGVVSGIGSELTGGKFKEGFKSGLITGAIAGGLAAGINIASNWNLIKGAGEAVSKAPEMGENFSMSEDSGLLGGGSDGTESVISDSVSPETQAAEKTIAGAEKSIGYENVSDKAVAGQKVAQMESQADILKSGAKAAVGDESKSAMGKFLGNEFVQGATLNLAGGLLTGIGQQKAAEEQIDAAKKADAERRGRVNTGIASAASPVRVRMQGNNMMIRRYSNKYLGA